MDIHKLKTIIKRHENEKGPLIAILQDVQDHYGYLPKKILIYIGKYLHIPLSRLFGVVTFYTQFHLQPTGQYRIKICLGTACHVKGATRILKKCEELLEIKQGQTTEDNKFTLEAVRCLGTCYLAPVIMINQAYYGNLTVKRIEEILKEYE